MGKGGNNLALYRNAVLIDLLIKRLAERNRVFWGIVRARGLIAVVEPKSNPIKKMKTCPISDGVSIRLIVGGKEDGRCEDPLEALHDAAVMATVFGKTEEV